MKKWILSSLTMAGAVMGVASAQSTVWNSHRYDVVFYDDAFPGEGGNWWGGHNPEDHSATRGGHLVTITSAEEEAAVGSIWPPASDQNPQSYTVLGRQTLDRTTTPPTVRWETGEASTYLGNILEPYENHWQLAAGVAVGGNKMQIGPTDQAYTTGAEFYILEIDPPPGDKDTDGDGILDENEKNTRHNYSFVQVPDPWDENTNPFGGWSYDRCRTDAAQRGGHIVEVSSKEELIFIASTMVPWEVRNGTAFNERTPTESARPEVNGVIVGGPHPNIYLEGRFQSERFSTYILEIENSTDPLKADTDDDGFSDKDELDAGSDPINPKSVPEVITMSVFPAIEVEVPTTTGTKYQLQVTAVLGGTWTPLGEVFVGTGQPHSRFIQAREAASFLRAVIIR